jgi:hypothetical protein
LSNAFIKPTDLANESSYSDITKSNAFKAQYDNKYCSYWYRYDVNYTTKDPHMPMGWERLTDFTNYGIPGEDPDNPGYLKVKMSP